MLSKGVRLVVGLGNPGDVYTNTRHNVGFWFIDELISHYNVQLAYNKKFFGNLATIEVAGYTTYLLCPTTLMNKSGVSVSAISRFYNIPASQILIVYDDLELGVGNMKLKDRGGHSGHNGIANIMQAISNTAFKRLRIGIGRPTDNRMSVSSYVLGAMPDIDKRVTQSNILLAVESVVDMVTQQWQVVVQNLHRKILANQQVTQ